MKKTIHHKKYRILISLLREKREASGLSQIQLAEKLNISQAAISKIETCERRLDLFELMNICEAINYPIIDLIRELELKLKIK